tara:strand:- start:1184 stop:3316 length:2133 start_codon:yes stop_codon:yes gene_type:complete
MKSKITRKTCRLAGIKVGLICKDKLWGIEYIDSPKGKTAGFNDYVHRPFALSTRVFQTRHGACETIHQLRCIGYEPGYSMASVGSPRIVAGKQIKFKYRDKQTGLQVDVTYRGAGKGAVIHADVTVTNRGAEPVTIDHISPAFPGLSTVRNNDWVENMHIHFARNAWNAEAQWYDRLICEEGMNAQYLSGDMSTFFRLESLGSFTSGRYLPMAVLEDRGAGKSYYCEIRYSGSWSMEVGAQGNRFYVLPSGPTKVDGQFWRTLAPGESLASVPIVFGVTDGGFNEAIAELTKYRRADLRPSCKADKKLPVIFDDYMNCLLGDPTEAKELPVIEAAAQAGAEYYVLDAGWSAGLRENWWTAVGEWRESPDRYPSGLKFIMDTIRAKGMVPGIWLEIEVMGVDCPMVDKMPDDWFFQRGGRRVIAANRYFLDYANPAVREHCRGIVDRLIADYGVGYLKIDYNINHREGNEAGYESPGAGQIAHIAGLYQWFDELREKYPDLIVENCGSGGGRVDSGVLERVHLQSTTDQVHYLRMPSITTGSLTAGVPEQLLQWAYPMQDSDPENVAFCIMFGMLSRFDLAGQIDKLSKRGTELVHEGIAVYKTYRRDIPRMIPFFPVGTSLIHDSEGFVVAGLKKENHALAYIIVYRLDGKQREIEIPLEGFEMKQVRAAILYPSQRPGSVRKSRHGIKVTLPRKRTARLIQVQRMNAPG